MIDKSWFKQKSPSLNPHCFEEIRLLSKKYFKMLSYTLYDTFENLTADWKKRDWTIMFDVLFVAFFKYRHHDLFYFQSSVNIPHFKQFLNVMKGGLITALPNIFNWCVMIMRFIRIEFTNSHCTKNEVFH